MRSNRVFLPQEALDAWLSEGKIELDGEVMTLKPEGRRFRLASAVRFMNEVEGSGDEHDVVGRVKDLEQLAELGGELCAGSVIVGDSAYDVVEGFVGVPIESQQPASPVHAASSLEGATRAAVGDEEAADERELDELTRFFLNR